MAQKQVPLTMAAVLAGVLLFLCLEPGESQLVSTKMGKYRGKFAISREGREYYEWIGIPFAEKPVGKLRFQPPVPKKPHAGIRDASRYNMTRCSQVLFGTSRVIGKEDCLYLSVHTPYYPVPGEPEKDLLPVIFFIHGGYFMMGSGLDFHPLYFMDEDVVIVSPNYRLGPFGFLNTGDGLVKGNMGLKDQAMALKWVYENIEHFGGDPNKITLYGESAGAASVHLHLMSNMSRGYVHRAISHSGTALSPWAVNRDPAGQARWLAKGLRCPTTDTKKMVKCFHSRSPKEILHFVNKFSILDRGIFEGERSSAFVPTIETVNDEDTFLAREPEELLREGQFAKVPWMVLMNTGEGLLMTSRFKHNETARNYLRNNWDLIAQKALILDPKERALSRAVQDFYFPEDVNVHSARGLKRLTEMFSDHWFYNSVQDSLRYHGRVAPAYNIVYNKTGDISVYDVFSAIRGRFPAPIEIISGTSSMWIQRNLFRIPEPFLGVSHGDDLFMLMPPPGGYRITRLSRHYKFSKQLVNFWVQFATGRNPLLFQAQPVREFNPKDEFRYFVMNDGAPWSGDVLMYPFKQRYLFWKALHAISRSL